MNSCQKRILELQNTIKEVNAHEAYSMQQDGAKIIDVRKMDEFNLSHIKNSQYLGRDYLEFRIEEVIPDKNTQIIVACGGGSRSLFASESLIKMGYSNIYNLSGGFRGWQEAGLDTTS